MLMVSYMMRIGNNRHRSLFQNMESRVLSYSERLFYLQIVELGHIPSRHMVKEYEVLTVYSILIFDYNYLPYQTHTVLAFVLVD